MATDNLVLSGSRTFYFDWRREANVTYNNNAQYFGESYDFDNVQGTIHPSLKPYQSYMDIARRKFTGYNLFKEYYSLNVSGQSNVSINNLNKYFDWDCKFQIEGVRLTHYLGNSLEFTNPAQIEVYDDQATKILKYNEMQKANSMSMEIFALSGYFEGSTLKHRWIPITEVKIQNFGRIIDMSLLKPYLVTESNVLLLGLDQGLAFRLKNKGYGLLSDINDFVNVSVNTSYFITGYYKRSFPTSLAHIGIDINSQQWTRILSENKDRIKLTISNNGESNATIYFAATSHDINYASPIPGLMQGIVLSPGGAWNDEGAFTQKQYIWAKSHAGNGRITGIESSIVAE